jgi:acylpyruvate hydrolase
VRLATARTDDGTVAVRVDSDGLVPLGQPDIGALLASDAPWREAAAEDRGEPLSLETTVLAPVVPRPEKIFCAGLNYRRHAEEAGHEIPEYPTLFSKHWRALLGPSDPLVLPPNSDRVDWEGELCVVIGRPARMVDTETALAAIAGYTVINDISMRDWQRRTAQWHQGKNFEASTPVGPYLVTLDELADPEAIDLTTSLDGETVQHTSTSDLIFSAPELVAYISQFITLVPGDLVATGTPSGVGGARKPPIFLQAGQTLRTQLAGIGELVTPVAASATAT